MPSPKGFGTPDQRASSIECPSEPLKATSNGSASYGEKEPEKGADTSGPTTMILEQSMDNYVINNYTKSTPPLDIAGGLSRRNTETVLERDPITLAKRKKQLSKYKRLSMGMMSGDTLDTRVASRGALTQNTEEC